MRLSYKEIVSRTGKPVDAWWVKFFADPVAIVLTAGLLRVVPGIHPNVITLGSLFLGLAAAGLFSAGEFLFAAILYQASFVLDCVDGKVARLQGTASDFGAFLDGLVNHLVYLGCVIGLGYGVGSASAIAWVVALLAIRTVNSFLNESLRRPSSKTWSHFVPQDSSWLARRGLLPPGSFPDKHALLFLLFPLIGEPEKGMALIFFMDVVLVAMKSRRLRSQCAGPGAGDE